MVFFGLLGGLVVGVSIPFMLPQMSYAYSYYCLVKPHSRHRELKSKLGNRYATSPDMYISYVKEIIKGNALFFITVIPLILQERREQNEKVLIKEKEDELAQTYMKLKGDSKEKISFEEYEKYLSHLEEMGKLQELEEER